VLVIVLELPHGTLVEDFKNPDHCLGQDVADADNLRLHGYYGWVACQVAIQNVPRTLSDLITRRSRRERGETFPAAGVEKGTSYGYGRKASA
jgi:hypothetical protein